MPFVSNRVDYRPIIERPTIKWPNEARVALWIAPNVEHYEYLPDYDGVEIINGAIAEHNPIKVYALVSGGNGKYSKPNRLPDAGGRL